MKIEELNTGANAVYLSALEKEVILEMNKARANPQKYAELYIKPRLAYYNGKILSVPGQVGIMTQEGVAAVNDCIAALQKAGSTGLLMPEKGLYLAAKDHVSDQAKTGQVGHEGSDKSMVQNRIKRYGAFAGAGSYSENIGYGVSTAREIVCGLLIDDGVPDRGHRAALLNGTYTQTGVSCGTHPKYRASCTITYANGYKSY